MLILYPYTFPPLHTLPSFLPTDHEIAHQWSGNPHSWDSIHQHQKKPQRLLVKLLTNILDIKRLTCFSHLLSFSLFLESLKSTELTKNRTISYLPTLPVFPGVSIFSLNLLVSRDAFWVICGGYSWTLSLMTLSKCNDFNTSPDFCTLGVGRYAISVDTHSSKCFPALREIGAEIRRELLSRC